jgi:hypothetical protein
MLGRSLLTNCHCRFDLFHRLSPVCMLTTGNAALAMLLLVWSVPSRLLLFVSPVVSGICLQCYLQLSVLRLPLSAFVMSLPLSLWELIHCVFISPVVSGFRVQLWCCGQYLGIDLLLRLSPVVDSRCGSSCLFLRLSPDSFHRCLQLSCCACRFRFVLVGMLPTGNAALAILIVVCNAAYR